MALRLRWPTEFGLVTQGFLERPGFYGQFKYIGIDGKSYALPGHEGLDLQAPGGSKVFACADGVVSLVRNDGNADTVRKPYGNQVRIQHAEGYMTIYAHLQEIHVAEGNHVQAGDVIGLADSTGNSTASHLHLTVKKQGASANGETIFKNDIVDPTPLLDPLNAAATENRSAGRTIPDFPLHGLHDVGAADWLRDHGVRGWAVEVVYCDDLAKPKPVDFSTHEAAGVRVLVRWNYSFASADGGQGTYPARAQYDHFVDWCGQSIRGSRGVWGHIIGNEPNRAGERPDYKKDVANSGTPIQASDVTYIVNAVWRLAPQATRISPPAIDPTNVETADPRKYLKDILIDLENVEFFALHAYSYGATQPVNSTDRFNEPLGWQYHSFRMWEPMAQVLYSDSRFRSKPVIITETNHLMRANGKLGWEANADPWITSMYEYLQRWNRQPGDQFVHGACLYRLDGDDWKLSDKAALLQALQSSGTQPT